ncbi:hypothetical protein BU14_0207s0013 [Porphyra umbilicalis]|uniref:Glycerol-3-phosphate dehydrogenase [NAD(+)] n=1 Tax=Porphyra umbilicalis TaxID=2786 RepID=A0A1X6P5I2_PORUM|nr:hypothetical protein BU14_0207s0013 [Porphyra umbilicalis]|eukprot:OSX76094.1 hypothetical protein BU14_0207s0013 [Porphyra umbilicalis]
MASITAKALDTLEATFAASGREEKVAIIGAGNWGSAAAMIIGRNCAKLDIFDDNVTVWCLEEKVDGGNLTDVINSTHVNVKYLPDHKLPENVRAEPDLVKSVAGATLLVFVLPHQFLARTCKTLKGHLAENVKAISLIKGIDFDDSGPQLMTNVIKRELGIEACALSGANIANEIAAGKFCESTIGYESKETGALFFALFNEPNFRISLVQGVAAPQVFGAIKNIVALGAGFCDALEMGNNTKAALMRIGLIEMYRFATQYFQGVDTATMVESCGMADLITTCMGGRNRRVAEAYARSRLEKGDDHRTWEDLEAEMLNGQKLQGTGAAKEVFQILTRDNLLDKFPFLVTLYRIAFEGKPIEDVVHIPEEHFLPSSLTSKAAATVASA